MVEANPADGSDHDDYDSDESKQEIEKTPEEKNALLLQYVKEGDVQNTEEILKAGADVDHEENGWNSLLWAACKGNEEMVRLLIHYNAHLKYKKKEEEQQQEQQEEGDEAKDNFKKVPDPAKTGIYTPMHWASYHGHYKVVWILMKENMSPLVKDMHGNNCIHQAAANGQSKVLKCFMQFGVDLMLKNARTHAPLDLATEKETRQLILKGKETQFCSGTKCNGSKFDFRNV